MGEQAVSLGILALLVTFALLFSGGPTVERFRSAVLLVPGLVALGIAVYVVVRVFQVAAQF